MILAGGLGTRLRDALPDTQKVMAPVEGQPFLARLIESLRAAGARRIVLALGYRAADVTGWFKGDPDLIASVEPAPRGTGGALRLAMDKIGSDTVLVLNGDSFAAADLAALVAFHRDRRAKISILLARVADGARYGAVEAGPDGAVTAFREKDESRAGPAWINAGVYLFESESARAIPTHRAVSLENEVFPSYCGAGLYAMRQDVPFLDIGTPASWREAGRFFAAIGSTKGGR